MCKGQKRPNNETVQRAAQQRRGAEAINKAIDGGKGEILERASHKFHMTGEGKPALRFKHRSSGGVLAAVC